MRVMGIDPGLTRCGLGVVDVDASRRASLVYVGVARTDKDLATHFRLRTIADAIDSVIERFSQNWRVDRLGKIELTLLRLAVFEMLYRADVPPKVAINEALELSTRFGDAKAKSFINGILDAAIKAQEAGTLTVAGKANA